MKKAIAALGSAVGSPEEPEIKLCRELGRQVAEQGFVLLTGACPGFPLEAARGAKDAGGAVVGISPALNYREHVEQWKYPTKEFDSILFPGIGRGRNRMLVRSAFAVVVLGGRMGTLNEFTAAFEEGKPIGVLSGIHGIGEHLEQIAEWAPKDRGAKIIRSTDPKELVELLAKEIGR